MKDPELIIEGLDEAMQAAEDDKDLRRDGSADAGGSTDTADDLGDGAGDDEDKSRKKGPATLKQLKEQTSEDDDAPIGSLTLRQILGGDYLLTLARHYVLFIIFVGVLTCIYVGVRYQCQQDVIEISRLEKELVKARFRAMSSSSNLTEMCRQSNVMKVLEGIEDNKLIMPEQPPYIIDVNRAE